MAITPRKMTNFSAAAKYIKELQDAVAALQTLSSAMSAGELAVLDGVVAGTAADGKAVVLTTNKVIDTLDITTPKIGGTAIAATADELNRAADVSTRIISVTTTPLAVSLATHEGKTVVLNKADGVAVTLPAATGSGAIYRFVVGTAASGGSYVFGVTGNDTFKGIAIGLDSEGASGNVWAAGASDEVFTMDGSTQGGAVGDEVVFQDVAADVWQVKAYLQQSGNEATPFSSAA